ncbi:flavin reductase [Corallincola spongiicola]|uniref:Flavin reductase n=2 Tax=Corallincola TaxID=1775176 RepID=A0ABY1WUI7_9GAMM|nr:flavin reductase [Corallincola spongiicola]TAA48416.1 flavin reductase [Corallincola spongiicola]
MFVNGVGVVLCGSAEDYVGMSIAWLTKVEKDHVLISVPKGALGTEKLLEEGRFTLSLLAETQTEIARQFGGSKQKVVVEKDQTFLFSTDWGTPAVGECSGVFLCEVISSSELNDQVLVIAQLSGPVASTELSPLVFRKSDFFA